MDHGGARSCAVSSYICTATQVVQLPSVPQLAGLGVVGSLPFTHIAVHSPMFVTA